MTARIVIIVLGKSEHCESPELDFSAILWYTIYRARDGATGPIAPPRSWVSPKELELKAGLSAGAESRLA